MKSEHDIVIEVDLCGTNPLWLPHASYTIGKALRKALKESAEEIFCSGLKATVSIAGETRVLYFSKGKKAIEYSISSEE